MHFSLFVAFTLCFLIISSVTTTDEKEYRGNVYLAMTPDAKWTIETSDDGNRRIMLSPEVKAPISGNEAILSWNTSNNEGVGLEFEVRAVYPDKTTKWYHLGKWSKEGGAFPRASLKGQKDADGDVQTDTLVLKQPTDTYQFRITLLKKDELPFPTIKRFGIALHNSVETPTPLETNQSAWGKEVSVPGKPQSGYPGASGWCSPTSTAMALAFWSQKLARPELDIPVPTAAKATFDSVYNGTGNWSFNTAYAGAFSGIHAYVSRFSDIQELEDWTALGLPVIVSVSYDLLRGKPQDNDPGHLLVCVGFAENGDIILNDPAYRPDKGEVSRKVFARNHFLKAWKRSKNTVYLIYADGAKLPPNRYGHWED